MISIDAINEEIMALIHDRLAANDVLDPDKLTLSLCSRHHDELVDPGDYGFHRIMSFRHARAEIGRAIRKKLDPDKEDGKGQLSFSGYDQLQTHYLIPRDGVTLGMPAHLITDDEFHAIAAKLRITGDAHHLHAREIIDYVGSRNDKP